MQVRQRRIRSQAVDLTVQWTSRYHLHLDLGLYHLRLIAPLQNQVLSQGQYPPSHLYHRLSSSPLVLPVRIGLSLRRDILKVLQQLRRGIIRVVEVAEVEGDAVRLVVVVVGAVAIILRLTYPLRMKIARFQVGIRVMSGSWGMGMSLIMDMGMGMLIGVLELIMGMRTVVT